MEKSELRRALLAAFSDEEWAALEAGRTTVPVSGYNREVLLALRDGEREFPGQAVDDRLRELRETVERYLARYWPEEPEAHKYVTAVCLALAFLYEKPMHPPEKAGYLTVVREGKARYFCPAREPGEGSVCLFCPAEPMDAPEAEWAEMTTETRQREGETSALALREVYRAGFQDAGVLKTGDLRFHSEVRAICQENRCRGYGGSWACPPAVGTPEECRARVKSFDKLLLFSKAYLLADSMDLAAVGDAMGDFKARALALGKALRPRLPRLLILSNEGCGRCQACTWPEAPCRFPEELQPSVEGFGFLVSELAQQAGIPYLNGKNTVTFFGAVLYDEGSTTGGARNDTNP